MVSPLHRSNSGYVDTDSDGVSERGVCVKESEGGGGSTWNTGDMEGVAVYRL